MNFIQAERLINFLNERFRQAGMKPWYRWGIHITWDKLRRWARMLGYKE